MIDSTLIHYMNEAIKLFNENSKETGNDLVEIKAFNQTWSNTSGGLEDSGFDALTNEPTVVINNKDKSVAYIYFKGRLAYELDFEVFSYSFFATDLSNNNVAGVNSYKERYEK